MYYKPDYYAVNQYALLNKDQKKLFEDAWENILDWAQFDGIQMIKPVKVQMVREIVYHIMNPDDDIVSSKTYIFNLTDMTEYINLMQEIDANRDFLNLIDYDLDADIKTSKKYMQIESKLNGNTRLFKVYSADEWE